MEMHLLLPGHRLLQEMMSPLASSIPLASLCGEFWDSLPVQSWLVLASRTPRPGSCFRWEMFKSVVVCGAVSNTSGYRRSFVISIPQGDNS